MKIIITGATGHIGSFISRDFAWHFPGAEIVLIDNMMTQRFSSLFNMPSIGRYRFTNLDVTKGDLKPIFSSADVVVHLAAITDAAASFDKAQLVEENNFEATLRVATVCSELQKKLIVISSTSVYGTQKSIVSEDCSADELRPQSPYAQTKLKEEALIHDLCITKGLKATICRFGTIYGASPGMRFHTAVNKFCWQAVFGLPISVWSSAYDQKRPYLDLMDASKALAFLIKQDLFDGKLYNILTENLTVRNVVDCIREFIPDLKISFVDSQIMNQLSYEVLNTKFLSEGFLFSGGVRRGIGETISLLRQANYFRLT